jgi:hypothetical protein
VTIETDGTDRFELLLLSLASVQPATGAVVVSVIVHVATEPELRADGLQETLAGASTVVNTSGTGCDTPFSEATMAAVPSAFTVPTVAVNVARTAPGAVATLEGTVSSSLSVEIVITALRVAEGLDRPAVQVVVAPVPRVVGEQEREIREAAGVPRFKVAVWETAPRVAVTVAV